MLPLSYGKWTFGRTKNSVRTRADRRVFPQPLFSSSPNFQQVFLQLVRNKENIHVFPFIKKINLFTLIIRMYVLFPCAFITSTACASSVFPSSISINLLALYHECCSLIGYATHYLSCCR